MEEKIILIAIPTKVTCSHCKEENDLRYSNLEDLEIVLPGCDHCGEITTLDVSEVRKYQ